MSSQPTSGSPTGAPPPARHAPSGEQLTFGPGDIVGGQYEVVSLLGEGGMGQVLRARDLQLNRIVAIKLIRPDVVSESALESFESEAKALSRLVHPNIVTIHHYGRAGRMPYIVMEFVEGKPLSDIIKNKAEAEKLRSVERVVECVDHVASALAEAHANGLLHRDIKPGNILLRTTRAGTRLWKVVDFGLAKPIESADAFVRTGRAAGSPAYMSPEQARDEPLDGRSDLYAIAVVVYLLFTGELPFVGNSAADLLKARVFGQPRPFESTRGGGKHIPPAMRDEIMKALTRERQGRHETVHAFAEALREAAGLRITRRRETVACPACGNPDAESGAYCSACGSAVPLRHCGVCGTKRAGERYQCISCGASLLTTARHRVFDDTGSAASLERMTSVALVVALEGPLLDRVAEIGAQFSAEVEREGGRPLAVLGNELIAAFGLGGMVGSEVRAALDTALLMRGRLQRDVDEGGGTFSIGVEVGSVQTRGVGFAWGSTLAGGTAIQVAREAARTAQRGTVVAGPRAIGEVGWHYVVSKDPTGAGRVDRRRKKPRKATGVWAVDNVLPLSLRDDEIASLRASAATSMENGQLRTIGVIADNGVGKSRLVDEAINHLMLDGWDIVRAGCQTLGVVTPYQPLHDLLQARLGASAEDDLLATVSALPGLADDDPERRSSRLDALGRLLGLAGAGGEGKVASRAELDAAYDAYVRAFTPDDDKPVVWIIEDLHAATSEALDLLRVLVRSALDRPVLVILTMRSAQAIEILDTIGVPQPNLDRLVLKPFDRDETERFVGTALRSVEFEPEVFDELHALSGGVAGRLEEALRALRESGAIVQGVDDAWRIAPGQTAESALRTSIEDLVLQRLGRLPPAERQIVQALAIAGTPSPRPLVERIVQREVADLELRNLVTAGFARRISRGSLGAGAECVLRQAEVARIVAEAVPGPVQEQWHAHAADWLVRDAATARGLSHLIAHHYERSGDVLHAAEQLLEAARQSLNSLANRRAFEAFTSAATVIGDASAKGEIAPELATLHVDALLGVARVGVEIGELHEAETAATKAIELAQEQGARLHVLQGRIHLGAALHRAGKNEPAGDVFSVAVSEAEALGETSQRLYALSQHAMVHVRSGRFDEAENLARETLQAIDERLDSRGWAGVGRLQSVLGLVMQRASRFDDAARAYAHARKALEHSGDQGAVFMIDVSVGNLLYRQDRREEAAAQFARAAKAAAGIDFRYGEAIARNNLGDVLLQLGRPRDALGSLNEAASTFRQLGVDDYEADSMRLTALAYLALDDKEAAKQTIDKALALKVDERIKKGIDAASEQILEAMAAA